MYKLLIVDDEPLVQVGIKSMLNWAELNIEIVGSALNGKIALEMIESTRPDIILADIKMPVMSGLELLKTCRELYGYEYPSFIILTSYEDFHMAKEALTYRANDYLVKLELTPEALSSSVSSIIRDLDERKASSSESDTMTLSDLHIFQEKLYMRLINNLFETPEQFLLQCRDFQVTFDSSMYLSAYLEFLSDSAKDLDNTQQMSLFSSAMNMLQEILVKYIPAHVGFLDLSHCAVIFSLNDVAPDTDSALIEQRVKKILSLVSDTLYHYYNVKIKTGIGSAVTDPLQISFSYQLARQAFLSATNDNPILAISENSLSSAIHDTFNVAIFRDTLAKAFDEFDVPLLQDTFSQITNLFTEHPHHYLQCLDAACNILYLSISLLPDGEDVVEQIFSSQQENYRSLYKTKTVTQIIDWLNFLCEGLSQLFLERKNTHTNHTVTSVKKYIKTHLREHLSLNEVAAIFSISPSYLSQLFKKYNDMGFNEFVTSQKITEAKNLMADNTLKIYEIADMLGFESAFYFSKVFKKVEGISPTEYVSQKLSHVPATPDMN